MYPKLGENLNQAQIALKRFLVMLGQLRKKVSQFTGN